MICAVGIERRHEQQDDVVEPPLRLGVVRGGERVRPLHGHLADDAISVAWMLQVTSTTALPSCARRSSVGVRESARIGRAACAISRIFSWLRMFSSEEMTAMIISSPSTVLPRTLDLDARRGGCPASRKYDVDLAVVGQRPVGADVHLQMLGRGGDVGGVGGKSGDGEEKGGDPFHAAHYRKHVWRGRGILQDMRRFEEYVQHLQNLVALPNDVALDELDQALDGQPAAALRRLVPLEILRANGAFFSGETLARRLVEPLVDSIDDRSVILDPACGAGDLLLAVAQHLPILGTLAHTLDYWGGRLAGRDIHPEFVAATITRLALTAKRRGALAGHNAETAASRLLDVRVGTALTMRTFLLVRHTL